MGSNLLFLKLITFSLGFWGLFGMHASIVGAPVAKANPFSFIAVGDTPYGETEKQWFRTVLPQAIAAAQVPFVVHYGDLKGGGEACTDALIQQTRDDIYALHDSVFYTPGDNEWTDCDRPALPEPKSELERLAFLRQQFYGQAFLPKGLYHRQANYPENVRWWYSDVLFTTLHVVGTNNGRDEILRDEIKTALAAVEDRDRANHHWLEQIFQEAQIYHAKAIVIVFQADISIRNGQGACTPENPSHCDGFESYRQKLTQLSAQFKEPDQAPNQTQEVAPQPVLLIYGDTPAFCMRKADFSGEDSPNLWLLNAWGDFLQPSDVTEITVQLDHPNQPFVAQTLLNKIEPKPECGS